MNIKQNITDLLIGVAKEMNLGDEDKIVVSFSNRPELCDFQSNFAMLVAKKLGQKPIEVAEKIVENLKNNENFEFFAVMPGFINIKIKEI